MSGDLQQVYGEIVQDNWFPTYDEARPFLDRLVSGLTPGERIAMVISFMDTGTIGPTGNPRPIPTLLAVTDLGVHLAWHNPAMDRLLSAVTGTGADRLSSRTHPFTELSGIRTRREMLSLGLSKQLHLLRPDGGFIKVSGMSADGCDRVEAVLRECMVGRDTGEGLRGQLEQLLRQGNRALSAGADGTPFATGLDLLAARLRDFALEEEVVDFLQTNGTPWSATPGSPRYIGAFRDLGRQGQPYAIVTVTTHHVIVQADVSDDYLTFVFPLATVLDAQVTIKRFTGNRLDLRTTLLERLQLYNADAQVLTGISSAIQEARAAVSS